MIAAKRKSPNAGGIHEDQQPMPKRNNTSNVLGYDAHAPWLHDAKPSHSWRTLGDRNVHSSLPLSNMVSAVQDLIDPDFDPLIAILDDEPRFLKPMPARVAAEDLEFLRFRGALSIPESELRNELLRCYVKWVHSFMPVLNLQEFLRCVAENDSNGNISLLLFQAVMFVATAFIDLKHLQAAGYSTRKAARSAFYTRLRLLYSLDCEEDRIVIVQTLLLMTYWADHMNHPQRDIWDWIGVCNTQAQSIGLNRDPSGADNIDPKTKKLRVRLWWSLYSRDRLIAMGMRRPTQVNEGTSNVPMLRLDDFDFEPYSPSVVELFHCRQLEDFSHQKRLATMFVEKTKLCQCIGRVLFAQYSPSQRQFGMTHRTTISLVPRQASESELRRCSQRLDAWLNGLPKDAQFIPASRSNFQDGEDVLLLHGAMVRMLYHATISALHRPWAYSANKEQSKARQELTNSARSKMNDAAVGITHIIQGLNQLNLTRFLPQSGVTVIIPAAVAHLANIMSDNPATREAGMHNFQRCVQVLQGLKDIYPAADEEVANIEAAVKVQSDSVATFLRIMQYTAATQPPQPQHGPDPNRRDSPGSTVQTIVSPPEDTSPPPPPPPRPTDPQQTTTYPHHLHSQHQHQQQQRQRQPSHSHHRPSISTPNPTPSSFPPPDSSNQDHNLDLSLDPSPDYDMPLDSHFHNALHALHARSPAPSSSSPYIPTNLLQLGIEPYTADFNQPNSNSNPNHNPEITSSNHNGWADLDIDWAEELLRGTDVYFDFSDAAGTGQGRAGGGQGGGGDGGRGNGSGSGSGSGANNITGDLDRDLGLEGTGDEMF